jgi:hypothetical protein
MTDEKQPPKENILQIERIFEQPPDAISFYAEMAQVIQTGHEVVLQFYETVPGPPAGPGGNIIKVRSRLRATLTLSFSHAQNLGKMLVEKAGGK